jgi:single-stranded DNA-binding protein
MILKSGSNIVASGTIGKVDYKEVGQKNTPLTTIGLAVGKKDDTTIWISCNFWGRHANIANNFNKGDVLLVSGIVSTFEANTGKKYEQCQVEFYSLLGKEIVQDTNKTNSRTAKTPADLNPIDDDDLPF